MADIVRTAADVSITKDRGYAHEIMSFIAGATIARGQPCYMNTTTGRVHPGDGSASGTANLRGIALNAARAGEAVDLLKRGWLEGYTLTQAYDAAVYLSDTAGELSDTVGTVTVAVGRVAPSTEVAADGTLKKLLYVDIQYV
jgi:hypothetical protein